jgi:hypothetical protein
MNKSVSHYLRDYLQLTGSAKFNFLTGGAERPLTASEASDLQAVINKYMIDIVPAVAANDVFKKQLMTKEQFDAAKAAASTAATYAAFANYTAFTADWKDVQKALVAALLLTADAEMAAAAPGEAASAPAGTGSPGKGSPGSAAAASVATGSPGSAVSPAGTGSPGAAAASPFTFRLRGGAASPSLLAAAIAASGVVASDPLSTIGFISNPLLDKIFSYIKTKTITKFLPADINLSFQLYHPEITKMKKYLDDTYPDKANRERFLNRLAAAVRFADAPIPGTALTENQRIATKLCVLIKNL